MLHFLLQYFFSNNSFSSDYYNAFCEDFTTDNESESCFLLLALWLIQGFRIFVKNQGFF